MPVKGGTTPVELKMTLPGAGRCTRSRLACLTYGLTFGLLLSAASDLRGQAARVSGTYQVRICRGPCTADSTHAYARGTLVLVDSALKDSAGRPISIRFRRAPANGCYVAAPDTPRGASYATIRKATVLDWSRAGRVIAFQLYQSPDAGYNVSVTPSSNGLIGIGREYGVGAAATNSPPDSIIAVRTGPARPAECAWFR